MKKLILAAFLALLLPVLGACGANKEAEASKDNAKGAEQEQKTEESKDEAKDKEMKEEKEGEKKEDAENAPEGEKNEKTDEADASSEPAANLDALEEGVFEGNKPFDFELTAFNEDKTYKLSDHLGKDPIVLTFFASWCGPCRMEMPELEEVYKEYKDKGLKVLAVNLGSGDNPENVEALISDYLLTFPVLRDEKSDVAFQYGVRGIPVNIFIGKDGAIKKHAVGMQTKETYEENVKALFEEEQQ